ncbi:type I polyketide synthase [Nonomuraea sp. B19D2]|uniref:type I polyketide synthase n=1 Tax=Nonomuraea sp. B19D2 TaxID=3159561 RepID=UPI0032D9ADA8
MSGEPIAIIGMSCRFAPDLNSPERLWEFLAAGRSAVGDMPEKRWKPYAASSPQATMIIREATRRGSFLDDIEGFDADFFGISPKEADFLDPQQRFMLELSWEALANAGIAPLSLTGTDASVYVAANSNDYGRRLLEDIPRTGAYAVNGTTFYGIANRVSYFLGLRGPSMAVDTACAGSLTALHVAGQALRSGETSLAIVGGVNIIATPALNVALEGAGAMSPDGRSKAFDKDADGYGRGEGAGVVVIKRLADARRDGDPVRAVILGSGVFQDGRSDGMMAPNAEAQEHMLREIYARIGVAPQDVDYVEAHGTGTPAGDGMEIKALSRVLGAGRPHGRPCLIGSAKPNIGHVEGGSGIAGVIKTVLALEHEQLPPSLHNVPNPALADSGLRLVGAPTSWPRSGRARIAGVSSYGVGGTIAHLVLEEGDQPAAPAKAHDRTALAGVDWRAVPASVDGRTASAGVNGRTASAGVNGRGEPVAEAASDEPQVFPLSAMSESGLRALAGSVADWLTGERDAPLASVGHTLSRRRSHLAQRAVAIAGSAAQLTERLRAFADEGTAPGVLSARVPSGRENSLVWVFSGHGAQWPGMGRKLLATDPVFAATIDSLADVFRDELGWTPREAIAGGGPWTAAHIQALTFAIQAGLAAVWRRLGVEPDAVIGHSVGEIAAAVAAGALDLEQAARFACRRAAALQRLEGQGAMVMAGLSFDETARRLAGQAGLEAAISASPHSTVISGDKDAVDRLAARWAEEGVELRKVDTEIAFHSRHVDRVLAEVEAAAAELTPVPPRIRLYSTAMADPRSTAARDSAYWAANLRNPVRFSEAVQAAILDGHRLFLEISSHPIVTHSIMETCQSLDVDDAVQAVTLRRNTDEAETILGNLAKLHCDGAEIDWSRHHAHGQLLGLPAAAWQHRPYWIFQESTASAGLGQGHEPDRHLLLGGRMTVSGASARKVWQTHLDMSCRPYPQSHRLDGVEVTPAASILNTFMAAAAEDGGVPPALADIGLRTALAVEPPRVVQIVREGRSLSLATRLADAGDDGDEWITHTTAAIDSSGVLPSGTLDHASIRARLPLSIPARIDTMFARMGVEGYAFPWELDELRGDDQEQLALMVIEPGPATRASSWAHVLDGALTISAAVVSPGDADVLWMSRSIGRVAFHGEPPARIIVHSRRAPASPEDTVDVLVANADGEIVCEVTGLRFAPVDHLGTAVLPRDLVHEVAWRSLTPAGSTSVEQVVLVGGDDAAAVLAAQLESAGTPCVVVSAGGTDDSWATELDRDLFTRPGAVVVVPPLGGPGDLEAATERATWTLIRTVQRLVEIGRNGGAAPQRLWCVTRGVRDAHDRRSLSHGPLWGVSRIIAGEHPDLWGGAVDLPDVPDDTGSRLLDLMRGAAGDEDVISLTGHGPEAARLSPIERSADGRPLRCSPSGTVLITGGLGALGLEVARWLAERGARRLLLVSRSGLPPRAEWDSIGDPDVRRQIDAILALEALGVTVAVVRLDITDPVQVEAVLAPGALGLPPITGVVHTAGVVNDAMVDKVDRDGLRDVLAPKVDGALALHRLFPPGRLDFFVLFSSCGQFARLTGQASYAAANSFLDALARHRNAGGHTETISLGWTSWRGLGLSRNLSATMLEANSRGLEAVTASEAFRAWAFGDRFQSSYQAILRVLPTPPNTPRLPMFRELTAPDGSAAAAAADGIAVDVAALSDEEARDLVTEDVRAQVAAELNLNPADVDLKRPLIELGVDSVLAVPLRMRLQRRYGVELAPTILWAKPNVVALAEYMIENLRARQEADVAEPAAEPLVALV